MKGEELVPGIQVIYGHRSGVKGICCNVYMLEGPEGILMIDSGNGQLGLEMPALAVLTHGHFDHTSGVRKGWNAYMREEDFIDRPPYKVPPGVKLLSLEPIKWGGFELELMHTPGHTPGAVCLLERRNRILFSGDTLFPDGEHGRTDLLGGDAEQMRRTLEKLKEVDYELLCAGHGEVERNG